MDELLGTTKKKYVCYFLSFENKFLLICQIILIIMITLVTRIYTMHCNNIYIYIYMRCMMIIV